MWEYVRTEVGEKEKKCKIIIINSLQASWYQVYEYLVGRDWKKTTDYFFESPTRRRTSCSESDAESIRN